jgi:hypothetical protein
MWTALSRQSSIHQWLVQATNMVSSGQWSCSVCGPSCQHGRQCTVVFNPSLTGSNNKHCHHQQQSNIMFLASLAGPSYRCCQHPIWLRMKFILYQYGSEWKLIAYDIWLNQHGWQWKLIANQIWFVIKIIWLRINMVQHESWLWTKFDCEWWINLTLNQYGSEWNLVVYQYCCEWNLTAN